MKISVEYLWVGPDQTFNSKCHEKTGIINITKKKFYTKVRTVESAYDFPLWSFDGSSTGHIIPTKENPNTEVILKPVKSYINPFEENSYIVLCETYNIDGTPHKYNTRANTIKLFESHKYLEPQYGLEQEYVFMDYNDQIYGWEDLEVQGDHYCNTSKYHKKLRPIVNEHYKLCNKIGLNMSGYNAEVLPCQWEFQIGPIKGQDIGDEMTIARFILERLAEKNGLYINYHSKPIKNYNGSGCHHNFSTIETRKLNELNYKSFYENKFEVFKINHKKTLLYYGDDNNLRLTGIHETSSIDNFTYGLGTRHTSIRIPINTYIYFEDRRPSSSCDPYLSCWALMNTYIEVNINIMMNNVIR